MLMLQADNSKGLKRFNEANWDCKFQIISLGYLLSEYVAQLGDFGFYGFYYRGKSLCKSYISPFLMEKFLEFS